MRTYEFYIPPPDALSPKRCCWCSKTTSRFLLEVGIGGTSDSFYCAVCAIKVLDREIKDLQTLQDKFKTFETAIQININRS